MNRIRQAGSKTSAVLRYLSEWDGASCEEIINSLQGQGFRHVTQSTTSGILSRLKREGAVRNNMGRWFLLRQAVRGGKTTVYELIQWLSKYPHDYEVVVMQKCEGDSSYHELDTLDEGFLPSQVVTVTPGDMISG